MARSDSSDSDSSHSSHHRSKHSKKKRRRRSRSRSSSSERSHRHKHKGHHHHHRHRNDSSHSRSSDKRKDRLDDRVRERSLPRSRDRSPGHQKDHSPTRSNHTKQSTNIENGTKFIDLNIKEANSTYVEDEQENIPSMDQIIEIDDDGFSQQAFTSTSDTFKKKKKKKKANINNSVAESQKVTNVPKISHESAMFGTATETMHVTRFNPRSTNRIDSKRREQLKAVETDDLFFGAMFCEDTDVRWKRWEEKLKKLREDILKGEAGTEQEMKANGT